MHSPWNSKNCFYLFGSRIVAFYLLICIHVCTIHNVIGQGDRNVRGENCQEDLLVDSDNSQFSASSVLESKNEQFEAHQARMNRLMETEGSHIAWCPSKPVGSGLKEWLEVNLKRLHIISMIYSKGRRQGSEDLFVSSYILRYQREDGGEWFNYSMPNGTQILSGNQDALNHVRKSLDIVVKRIRIYPYNKDSLKPVCFKLKLYGCLFQDAVVEYEAPTGYIGDGYHYIDRAYDHPQQCLTPSYEHKVNCWLSGGMGVLMDNKIYTDPLSKDVSASLPIAPIHFVGWNRAIYKMGVFMTLRLASVRQVNAIHFHMANLPEMNIGPYSQLFIRISMSRELCPTVQRPFHMQQEGVAVAVDSRIMDDRFSRSSWLNVTLGDPTVRNTSLMGLFVCLHMTHQRDLIAMSEILLNSTEVLLSEREVNHLKEIERNMEQLRLSKKHALTATDSNGLSPQKPFVPNSLGGTSPPSALSFSTFPYDASASSSGGSKDNPPYNYMTLILLILLCVSVLLLTAFIISCLLLRNPHLRDCCSCVIGSSDQCGGSGGGPSGNKRMMVTHGSSADKNVENELYQHQKQWIDYIPTNYPSLARQPSPGNHNHNALNYLYASGQNGLSGPLPPNTMNGYQAMTVTPYHQHNWSAASAAGAHFDPTSPRHFANGILFPRMGGSAVSPGLDNSDHAESTPFLYNTSTNYPLTDDTGSQIYEQAGNPSPITGIGLIGTGAALSSGTASSHTTSSSENSSDPSRKSHAKSLESPARLKHPPSRSTPIRVRQESREGAGSPGVQLPPLPPNHPSMQSSLIASSPFVVSSSPMHHSHPHNTLFTTPQRVVFHH